MNNRLSLGISLLLGISAPTLWSSALRAADVPSAPHVLNVARANLGARLTVELPASASTEIAPRIAQALLSEDDPLGCELPAGITSLVVALPRTETLHHLDFLNLTAAGQVSIAASNVRLPADSPRWRALGGAQDFAQANDVVACELGTTEARYVRVTFNLPKAGRIDTLGLFGDATVASARPRTVGGRAFVGYEQLDSGNASAQARVTKISSGGGTGEADKMLDGNLRTSYTFEPTDRHPTTVVDLGANRTLTRTSIAFRAGPGRMDFYLTPDPNAHTSIVRRNPSYSGQTAQVPEVSSSETTADRNPIATYQSDGRPGLQRVTVGMSGETGRFLAVTFTPSGGNGSRPPERRGSGDYKDFKDRAADYKDFKDYKDAPAAASDDDGFLSDSPLSVSELGAFGPPSSSITTIPQLPSAGQNFSPGPTAGPTAEPTQVITP